MANLTSAQKHEIVSMLACFREPTAIIRYFRLQHGLELTHKQVGRYDPTRSYYEGGNHWREIFEVRRNAYLTDVNNVPIAHQAYRLNVLQEGVEFARQAKNWKLVADLLRQAAKEVGGSLTNRREVDFDENRRRLVREMTPEKRESAMAEIIQRAIDQRRHRISDQVELN